MRDTENFSQTIHYVQFTDPISSVNRTPVIFSGNTTHSCAALPSFAPPCSSRTLAARCSSPCHRAHRKTPLPTPHPMAAANKPSLAPVPPTTCRSSAACSRPPPRILGTDEDFAKSIEATSAHQADLQRRHHEVAGKLRGTRDHPPPQLAFVGPLSKRRNQHQHPGVIRRSPQVPRTPWRCSDRAAKLLAMLI